VLEQGKNGKGWKRGKDSKNEWRKRRIKLMEIKKIWDWRVSGKGYTVK
jgi:hypothetical protein